MSPSVIRAQRTCTRSYELPLKPLQQPVTVISKPFAAIIVFEFGSCCSEARHERRLKLPEVKRAALSSSLIAS